VDPLNPFYADKDGMLLSKDEGFLLRWPGGRVGTCTIPATVTNIEIGAFEGSFVGLTNIIIPGYVSTIPDSVFRNCSGLLGIQLPDDLTTIGEYVFAGCKRIQSLTIPSKVRHIGDHAFLGCSALQAINVSELNPYFLSIDGVLFSKDGSTLFSFPGGRVGKYTIPTGVSTLGVGSFHSAYSLSEIGIPSTVTNIQRYAFLGCRGIKRIVIPASVVEIGERAFSQTGAEEVFFLGDAVFEGYWYNYSFDYPVRTIYYLPGAVGWSTNFQGIRTMLWNPRPDTSRGDFGIRTNRFSFMIVGLTNYDASVVVEANTNMSLGTWVPVSTNSMMKGYSYFTDSGWTNFSKRYYRLRSAD
jgi:hypothetical protein